METHELINIQLFHLDLQQPDLILLEIPCQLFYRFSQQIAFEFD